MIKVSIKLDKRRRLNNGKYPLKFKIARKDKAIYIPTGYELEDKDWDSENEKVKNIPEKRNMNIKLGKRLSDINEKIIELQSEGKLRFFSNKKLSLYLSNEEDKEEYKSHLFKTQMESFLAKKDSEGTKRIYLGTENKIKEFCDYDTLRLEDIDIEWLDNFVEFLKKSGNAKNTIASRLRGIRAILNFSRKKGLIKEYVFNMYSIKTEETKKRSLTVEELRKLHDANLSFIRTRDRDIFFLIFYLMGINITDLSKIEKIENGRIVYRRAKTGTLYNIKIEPEAMEIIERYKGKQHLLRIFDTDVCVRGIDQALNNVLKRTCESLEIPIITTYWARHTFATIAYEIGIPMDIIADCLGHKSGHHITQIYVRKDQQKIDEANRKVIDYVLYNKKG
uniref:Integrase n=1 Tax=Siphoviridae sp. ctKwY15 TaxID=2827843 RepID=A0A8S5SUC9_9CAUD|nr:MAG TPA: Integrase [Siphoviridae sp. ctKwY15]